MKDVEAFLPTLFRYAIGVALLLGVFVLALQIGMATAKEQDVGAAQSKRCKDAGLIWLPAERKCAKPLSAEHYQKQRITDEQMQKLI